ncbi:MAG: UDP-glucose 4-epimerase GalE [Magnetospirillum sp.]|nr:UDP-glucose 4-epimerase GalE [Magnetospirillum sp.]
MDSVLVTGGAGYVGSHACKALAVAGWTPVVYDNLDTGHRDLARYGPFEPGDIGDRERLEAAIRRHRPLAVMHFAARSLIGSAVADPLATYRTNVAGTLTVLEAMRRLGVGMLVYSSSCAVYGHPATVPITEDAPLQPVNPYGWSKLAGERMIADAGAAYGPTWTALRYFNAAGADPEGEIGEDHRPESHLIPRALMAAASLIDCLEVYGGDYATPDGTCVRDYVHVSDLARWHVAALERLRNGGGSVAVNLGSGRGWSVREVVGAVEAVTGRTVPLVTLPRRPGDPPVLVADPARAAALLGGPARLPGLDRMIDTAWRWLQRRRV